MTDQPRDLTVSAGDAPSPDYEYNAHRYQYVPQALADAYRAGVGDDAFRDAEFSGPRRKVPTPTAADRALMVSLHIQFDGTAYRFGGYAYDRLADAASYARRAAGAD
jgi:hypothetical protein